MASEENAGRVRQPPIPSALRRAVRERCAYGCVICGHPLYVYHHIRPYAEVKVHKEANLTLLCSAHHREAASGHLLAEQMIEADVSPFNRQAGVSSPFAVQFSGTNLVVELGSNRLSGGFRLPDGSMAIIPLSVDDFDLFSFRVGGEGNVYLYLTVLDECNLPLLQVYENELVYGADGWDVAFEGRVLTLRQARRQMLLEVEFRPPNGVAVLRGRLLCNGVEILIGRDCLFIVGSESTYARQRLDGCAIAVQLGRNERRLPCCIRPDPRDVKRYGFDRDALLRENRHMAALVASITG